MSFRDRLLNIAIGFGIGACIALAGAWALDEYQRRAECGYYSAQPHCQDAPNVSPNVRVSPIGAEKGPNPDPYPDRKEWREEQDLQAQRDQAYWAWGTMIAALMSVGVTGIGVVLLWFTLGHTADAAVAAKEAVVQARAATKAAQDMLRGERAWMIYAHVEVDGAADQSDIKKRIGFQFRIRFQNQGRSPAKKCLVTSRGHFIDVGLAPNQTKKPTPLSSSPPDNTIGAQGFASGQMWLFTFDQIRQEIDGKKALFLTARVDYEDIFDDRHTSESCIRIHILTDMDTLMLDEVDTRRCFGFNTLGPANYTN